MSAKINLEGTGNYFEWKCDFCGEYTDDGMLSRIVIEEGGEEKGRDICRNCLDAGKEGAVQRTIEYAEYLEGVAKFLRNTMTERIRGVEEWKTGKDYDAVQEAFEAEIRKEIEAGESDMVAVDKSSLLDMDDFLEGFMNDDEEAK